MRNPLRYSFLILSAAALLAGCSSSNVETVGEVHPAGWYQLHRSNTTAATFAVDCGGCHVVVDNVAGPASPPSCFSASFDGQSCHADGPGSAPHPVDGTFLSGAVHGTVAKADLTLCQECHSDNPNGGPGSNPRFNVGIDNSAAPAPGTGCEQCHGQYAAHPSSSEGPGVRWAGPNDNNTFHYSAGNIQAACTLCHGVSLQGVNGAGGIAGDCTTCHAETTNFTLDCAACHGFPPSTTVGSEVAAEGGVLVEHSTVPLGSHDQCAICHGVKNSSASGTTGNLDPSANFQAFDPAADTIGDHWNGSINMNSTVGYNETDFGCDLACHANDAAHQMSDSALTVDFGAYGSGGAPHAVGDSWLTLSGHASAAVNTTLDCVGCHSLTGGGISPACQDCHETAPNNDLTTAGCTSCHSYPPDGVTPVATDPNVAGQHAVHVGFTAATADCSGCHQGGGSDSATHYDRTGVTTPNLPAEVAFPAAYNAQSGTASYDATAQTCATVSCHGGQTTPNWLTGTLPAADPATSNEFCLSCHAAGTNEFNSYFSGEHDFHLQFSTIQCADCHDTTILQNGAGGTPPTHWSGLDTSTFELDPALTVGVLAVYDGTSCSNTAAGCHNTSTRNW